MRNRAGLIPGLALAAAISLLTACAVEGPEVTTGGDGGSRPPAATSGGSGAAPAGSTPAGGTLTAEPAKLEGLGQPLRVRYTLAGGTGPYAATVTSGAEPDGEALALAAVPGEPGVFASEIPLERVYAADGSPNAIARNGMLAVYAEGEVRNDAIGVKLGDQEVEGVTYEEPPSTVTGVVRVGGMPVEGALVEISGDAFGRSTGSRTDGSFSFFDVPTGRYTVVAATNGAIQKTVVVNVP